MHVVATDRLNPVSRVSQSSLLGLKMPRFPSLALVLAASFHFLSFAAKASCFAIKYDLRRACVYYY